MDLFVSKLSGKFRVMVDNETRSLVTRTVGSLFQYPFEISKHRCNILQHADSFEFRIDNQAFSHLYNLRRMQMEFGSPEELVS